MHTGQFAIILLSVVCTTLGALFRRYWGGWLHPDDSTRKVLAVVLAANVGLYATFNTTVAVIAAIVLGAIWWVQPWYQLFWKNAPSHGWAQSMGKWPGHPWWACILVFTANYGLAMVVVGISWSLIAKSNQHYAAPGMIYALAGLGTWIPHFLAAWFPKPEWEKDPTQGYFIDSYTAVGELGLGGWVFGWLPLSVVVARLWGL